LRRLQQQQRRRRWQQQQQQQRQHKFNDILEQNSSIGAIHLVQQAVEQVAQCKSTM
jgi:hypothetical protein